MSDSAATQDARFTPNKSARPHLEYLDGVRGLAALYVVLYHARLLLDPHTPAWLFHILAPLNHGHYAVDVFIVLSGYCLMLPVARSADRQLRGGIKEYLRRRARRILPPYYAALIASLLISYAACYFGGAFGNLEFDWQQSSSMPVLVSHLFLLHNLSPDWARAIDPPMWSVATEWQIYFVFPLLMLPLWRRFGIIFTIIVGFLCGYGLHCVTRGSIDAAAPWFIGLFSLGMGAATVGVKQSSAIRFGISRRRWGALALILWIGAVVIGFILATHSDEHWMITDPPIGLATAVMLVYCTQVVTEPSYWSPPLLVRLFSSRGAVTVGAFSYSLYLVHFPILTLSRVVFFGARVSPITLAALVFFLVVPISIGLAYLFYLAFERPFMSRRS